MVASNPNTPFGLQPRKRLDGAAPNFRTRVYFVPAAKTNALYLGDPVTKIAAAADVNGVNAVDLSTAGSTNAVTGVIVGFLGTATAGSGNTPTLFGLPAGNAYRPASTTLDWYVLVCDDYEAEWEIQADNNYGGVAGTPVPVAAVGKNINLAAGTGSIYTGWSGWYANSNSIGTTAAFQLNIVGLYTDTQNTAGNLYQKLIVRLNNTTEAPASAGI